MVCRLSVPGDGQRYLDSLHVRTLRLYAVHACERFNHKRRRKYRLQVLGSVLVWAHRANATRVINIPASDEPFVYYAADGTMVESEFPQPTDEVRNDLRTTLFLDAYDGHPIFRPIRRCMRRRSKNEPQLKLKVPDFQNNITSIWHMTIGRDATTIVLTGIEAYSPPARAK